MLDYGVGLPTHDEHHQHTHNAGEDRRDAYATFALPPVRGAGSRR